MRFRTKQFFIYFLILIFSGCATKKFNGKEKSQIEEKAPGWIDGASKDFTSEKYFVGVGVSNICCTMDKKLAASKGVARAEIAKIFQVKIETVSKETLNTILVGQGKYSSRQTQESYKAFVNTSTDMILEGIEIKDSYKGKGGEIYTLAVLEKEKALELFQNKLKEEIYSINKNMDEAAEAIARNNLLLAIKINRKILVSSQKIALLNAQVVVAGGKMIKIDPEQTPGFIKIKIDRLFSQVSIGIVGEDKEIETHILEALTKLGFRVKKTIEQVDYIVKYNYSFYDDGSVELSGDYVSFKARSNLAIEFFIKGEEKVIGKSNLEGRGVGKTQELAAKHAVKNLASVIEEEFVESIFNFL